MSRDWYGSLLYEPLTGLVTGFDVPVGADEKRPSNRHCAPCCASNPLPIQEESTRDSTGAIIVSHLYHILLASSEA